MNRVMDVTDPRADRSLFERGAELATIERATRSAAAGEGSVILIQGHAGVGKTALLQAALERLTGFGVDVLTARAAETEKEFSFGVVLQLLQRRIVALSPSEREDVLSGAASLARPLLEGAGVQALGGPEAAFAFMHGLYWVVANLAERRPIVLAVDDVHWADASSVRFLATLANRLEGLSATIVLTRRLGESVTAPEALDAIAEVPTASVISLKRLSDDAVAAMIRLRYGRDASGEFNMACVRAVRGNPMYLRELLTELRARGVPANAAGAGQVSDMSVDALNRSVRARLGRAGDHAIRLAEAVSVADGGMSLRLVGELAELSDAELDHAARTLIEADILETGDPVSFVHPLVRNAVYQGVGDRRRAALHRHAAELLRDEKAEPERIAGHLLATDPSSEPWVVEALLATAGSAIERAAPKSAVRLLRRALSESAQGWRAQILAPLGLAALASSQPDALQIVREAASLAPTPRDRAMYLLAASETLFLARRLEESFEIGRTAMADIDPEDDEETSAHVVSFMAGLSMVMLRADPVSVSRLPGLCDRIARRGSPETPAQRLVMGTCAGIITMTGERPSAEASDLALRALSTAPGEELRGAMFQAPMGLTFTDNFAEAENTYNTAIHVARRLGLQYVYINSLGQRADTRYRAGNLPLAIADAEAAVEGGRGAWIELWARSILSFCLLDAGDIGAAEQAIRLRNVDQWSAATHSAIYHDALGRVLLATGKLVEAIAAFREAERVATVSTALNPAFCAWRSGMAEAENALGNHEEARRLADEEVRLAKAFGAPRAIGVALRARGLIEGGNAGIASLQEAVDVLEGSASRLEFARALTDLGAALRRAGATSEARERIRLGLDVAAECGAAGLANRARTELISAGGRPRRERLTGVSSLTPQEQRVAELVVEGRSNREIAQALFLTRKTIETHLTNVYSKLGIRSRSELGAALHRDAC